MDFYKKYIKYKYKYNNLKLYGSASSIKYISIEILIACHPKKVSIFVNKNTDNYYHWWNLWLQNFIKDKYNSESLDDFNINVTTVDIQANGTQNIIDDVFNEQFIIDHTNKFDIILYPDCAGEWFTVMNEPNMIKSHAELVNKVLPLVKSNGFAIFQKSMIYELKETLTNMDIQNIKNIETLSYPLMSETDKFIALVITKS